MLTINVEIRAEKQKADGTYNVKLRFTLDRKMRRLSTSLCVTAKDSTNDLKIKKTSLMKNRKRA